MDNENQEVEN